MVARWLVLLALPLCAIANAEINRCVAPDGVLVFTDQSCEALGIAERGNAPMPRRRVGAASAASKLSFGCAARSPEGLRVAVIDAMDRRDFNALAGLYNFDGRSRQTAAGVVRRLERMARQPAKEVELVAIETESLFDVLVVDTGVLPTLRVVQKRQGNEGSLSIENFSLARSAGCLWLGG